MTFGEQDKVLLKLRCKDCDNIDCSLAKKWVDYDGLNGCSRWVNEEVYILYIHYLEEVLPFWHIKSKETQNYEYKEIIDFLGQEIYTSPLAHCIDAKGKIID